MTSRANRAGTAAVSSYGLTHLALGVKEPARAFGFYRHVFGMVAVYRGPDFIQAQTPGSRDVLVFERSRRRPGTSGAIAHFGFRLTDPADIDRAVAAVRKAGGTIVERGEFVPGEPYVFARDLDGYTSEIWYELPTTVDPPARPAGRRRATRTRRRPVPRV
jgi:catechol 2,3-dioxygenase-like lactoylglutathione lyase family enzyme